MKRLGVWYFSKHIKRDYKEIIHLGVFSEQKTQKSSTIMNIEYTQKLTKWNTKQNTKHNTKH